MAQEEDILSITRHRLYLKFRRYPGGRRDISSLRPPPGQRLAYKTDIERYRRHFADTCLSSMPGGNRSSVPFRPYFIDKTSVLPGPALPCHRPQRREDEIRLLDDDGKETARNTG